MPGPTAAAITVPADHLKSVRLHYLDWIQVLAVFMVFLFHAVHPFDDLFPWHIKNAEPSLLANFFIGFFGPWGMPFFFLVAGMTSWFSLRRRTAARYVRERFFQLLVPFLVGAVLLTPIQALYEMTHKGLWQADSTLSFMFSPEARSFFFTHVHPIVLGPKIFGILGYHLWFLGFLFAFSLLALPVFLWLKTEPGARFHASLARLADRRGGLLVLLVPALLSRLILQPLYPAEHDWAEFTFNLLFFVSGYILIADQRFMQAIRRDWKLYLILGIACTLFFFSSIAGVPILEWVASPGTLAFYVSWTVFSLNGWCWTMFIIFIAMRYLGFANRWLPYAREASFAFFWVHQPVIIYIAFWVVQWDLSLWAKMLVVVIGSFAVSLALYEVLVRRIDPIRTLFGMKPRRREAPSADTG